MIGVNPLRTKVLITSDEVVFHAPTDQTVDPRVIMQNIILAERRFIKPLLGSTLYKTLIDKKNILVTTANKDELQTELNDGRTPAGMPANRAVITLYEGDYVNSDIYLDSNQLKLWQDYLHKITAECVWFVALVVNRARFNSAGIVKNFPETISENRASVTIDLPDLKHLLDKGLNERITVLIQDMVEYLCETKFPGYTIKDCGDCNDNGAPQKSSGVIFGLYDDEPKKRGW